MKIFNGKKAALKILEDLKGKIAAKRIIPALAVISAGSDSSSALFIRNKERAAKSIGIRIIRRQFKETANEAEIIKQIKVFNQDRSISGIIVQLPLPKRFNTDKIISAISPKKDVDGFHKINRELLKKGGVCFLPPLPSAILIALKESSRDLKSKKILALVNSDILGETFKLFFRNEGVKIRYFLRKQLEKSAKLKSDLAEADIFITVCGCPNSISGKMVKKGVILIDGGISLQKGKIAGDIDRKSVAGKASFLTPVPGGVGPLTIALLLKNLLAAEKLN